MEKWSNFDFDRVFRMSADEVDELIANKSDYIKEFRVKKRSGGTRKITNPTGKYRYVLTGLQYRLLSKYKISKHAHGFAKGRSVVTGAKVHFESGRVNATGSIDVVNFFDNIKQHHLDNVLYGNKRVCTMCKNYKKCLEGQCSPSLYENKEHDFPHKCEEVLANVIPNYEELSGYQSILTRAKDLMLYKGSTPQGFPTSPALANIALRGMDEKIAEECKEIGVTYTRYADDLSFSTTDHDKIWLKENTLGMATSILNAWKLKVNKRKTKYCGRGTRLQICSIVINDHPSLAKWKVKNFRAELHNMFVKNPDKVTKADIKRVKGWCSWLMSVNPKAGEKYMKQIIEFEKTM